jgi:hypothetical protein
MQIDPKMNPNTLLKNSIDVTQRDGATKAPNMHAPSLNNTFPNPNQRTHAIDVASGRGTIRFGLLGIQIREVVANSQSGSFQRRSYID